jgi:radical SAM superfamily enzyme YgiQ (UPF0313 family)/selenocysteine lyase/cysteine desulfurase
MIDTLESNDLRGIGPSPEPLARNLCHIGDPTTGKRVWFVHAPFGDEVLRFRGEPTSLLYAIAPFVDDIRRGVIPGYNIRDVALLNPPSATDGFYREFAARIRNQRLRMVCISTATAASAVARRLANIVKEHNPRIVVVFGGPHEDDSLTPTAQFCPDVDFAVRGDGEFALRKLGALILSTPDRSVAELKQALIDQSLDERPYRRFSANGRGIVAFRQRSREIVNILFASNQGLKSNKIVLDELPLMPRDLMLVEDTAQFDIFRRNGRNVRTAQIMTQRGCVWSCSFCSESSGGQVNSKFTDRSVESVLQEVDAVITLGYRAIFFDDSTFTSRAPRRAEFLAKLFNGLRARCARYDLEWGCQTRVDQIDQTILHELKEAGCSYVYLGVESSSAEMLRHMHKGIRSGEERKTLVHAFEAVNEVGMRVGVSLIFGVAAPGSERTRETRETVLETLRFIRSNAESGNVACVSLNLATYYPSTQMTLDSASHLDFTQPIVHRGFPWNRYEEGEGHHPVGVDSEFAEFVVHSATHLIGEYLVGQDLYAIDELIEPYREGKLPRERVIYLNHASLTQPLDAAIHAATKLDSCSCYDTAPYDDARSAASTLFGLRPEMRNRVVLARNTTEAIALAFHTTSIGQQGAHGRVLVTDAENLSVERVFRVHQDHGNPHGRDMWSSYQDFGAAVAPLAEQKQVPTGRIIEIAEILRLSNDDRVASIVEKVTEETEIVLFSHVIRDTGEVLNAREICRALRAKKPELWIIIDGAQALGALPEIDVPAIGCDFYAATPHKTLGSYALGLLYLGDRARALWASRTEWTPKHSPTILEGMFDPALGVRTAGELSRPEVRSFTEALRELSRRELVKGSSALGLAHHRDVLKKAFLGELERQGYSAADLGVNESGTSFIASLRFRDRDNRAIAERLWREYWVFVSYIARSDVIRVSFGADNTVAEMCLAARAFAAAAAVSGPRASLEPTAVEPTAVDTTAVDTTAVDTSRLDLAEVL